MARSRGEGVDGGAKGGRSNQSTLHHHRSAAVCGLAWTPGLELGIASGQSESGGRGAVVLNEID